MSFIRQRYILILYSAAGSSGYCSINSSNLPRNPDLDVTSPLVSHVLCYYPLCRLRAGKDLVNLLGQAPESHDDNWTVRAIIRGSSCHGLSVHVGFLLRPFES